jgi:hypothetical protein
VSVRHEISAHQLRLLVRAGRTDRQMAEARGVSERTIRRHLRAHDIRRERLGQAQPRGYLLRLEAAEVAQMQQAAQQAGFAEGRDWLRALLLEGPGLVRVARHPQVSSARRQAALDALLRLVAGPAESTWDSSARDGGTGTGSPLELRWCGQVEDAAGGESKPRFPSSPESPDHAAKGARGTQASPRDRDGANSARQKAQISMSDN